MMKKWKDSRGETLVEVLAAILIASLSVTLVFGAIMASATMDRQAQDVDGKYYDALSKAERQGPGDEFTNPSGTEFQVKVAKKVDVGAAPEVTLGKGKVTFYGGEGAVSYALNPPAPLPGGGGI